MPAGIGRPTPRHVYHLPLGMGDRDSRCIGRIGTETTIPDPKGVERRRPRGLRFESLRPCLQYRLVQSTFLPITTSVVAFANCGGTKRNRQRLDLRRLHIELIIEPYPRSRFPVVVTNSFALLSLKIPFRV